MSYTPDAVSRVDIAKEHIADAKKLLADILTSEDANEFNIVYQRKMRSALNKLFEALDDLEGK